MDFNKIMEEAIRLQKEDLRKGDYSSSSMLSFINGVCVGLGFTDEPESDVVNTNGLGSDVTNG